jgi:hypothetical protein
LFWLLLAQAAALPASGQQTLVLTPELRIDGVANNLVGVSWILVGRDGRLVVSQPDDRKVNVYDASGRPLGSFGGRGQGPGEFQSLTGVGWVGTTDSVWIHDLLGQKTTVFSPGFSYVRDYNTTGVTPPPGSEQNLPTSTSSVPLALYQDGTSLVRAMLGGARVPAGFDTNGTPIFRVAGNEIRSYVAHQRPVAGGTVGIQTAGGGSAMITTPFFARPQFNASHRGTRIASLTLEYEGPRANTMRMVVISGGGDTVYARNYPFSAAPVPRSVADSAMAAVINRAVSMDVQLNLTGGATLASAVRAGMKIPPVYPAFTSMVIADDGTAWIGLRTESGAPARFMVLDATGNITGIAVMPPRVRPLTVSASHVWGVELDEDDVPSVVRFRVAPPR